MIIAIKTGFWDKLYITHPIPKLKICFVSLLSKRLSSDTKNLNNCSIERKWIFGSVNNTYGNIGLKEKSQKG